MHMTCEYGNIHAYMAKKRYAMRNLYIRGFLRQQENQYVSVPDEVVDQCSPKLRRMMGYRCA